MKQVLAFLAAALVVATAMQQWEEDYCTMKQVSGSQCQSRINAEIDHCAQVAKSKFEYVREQDGQCNAFKDDVAHIQDDQMKTWPHRIRDAAAQCAPAMKAVCIQSNCPAFCAANKIPGCDCTSMCESVLQNAYNTGYLECEKKENGDVESFADCQKGLNDALAGAGRFPALEALMRDHYMKCMCVSRQDNTATCYEGSQGIPPGKRWCDPTTNSWLKIMNDKCPGSGPSWCGAPAPQCQAKFPTLAALRTQSARLPTTGLAMLLGAAGGVSASLTIVAVMRKVTSQREPSEYVNLAA